MNNNISESIQYQTKIEKALIDFSKNHIQGHRVTGVFLTGGASRMNFLMPIIKKVFNLEDDKVRIDPDNPSLTISRGIAMLGTADAITTELVSTLKNQMEQKLKDSKFHKDVTSELSTGITAKAWNIIEESGKDWVKNGTSTKNEELTEKVKKALSEFMYSEELIPVINKTLENCAKKRCEDFRKVLNELISVYSPGREITDDFSINNDKSMHVLNALKSAQDSVIEACADLKSNEWLGRIVAGIVFLFFSILGGLIIDLIFAPTDEEKRQRKVNALINKKNELCKKMTEQINNSLKDNKPFKKNIDTSFRQFFSEYIDTNLNNVMIPIE